MDRLSFYSTETVDGVKEIDFLTSNLHKFQPRYELTSYRVSEQDILRPDLISYVNYNTKDYWWLILFYNGIVDPFSELEVGDLLYIPNLIDVYEFYKQYRQR